MKQLTTLLLGATLLFPGVAHAQDERWSDWATVPDGFQNRIEVSLNVSRNPNPAGIPFRVKVRARSNYDVQVAGWVHLYRESQEGETVTSEGFDLSLKPGQVVVANRVSVCHRADGMSPGWIELNPRSAPVTKLVQGLKEAFPGVTFLFTGGKSVGGIAKTLARRMPDEEKLAELLHESAWRPILEWHQAHPEAPRGVARAAYAKILLEAVSSDPDAFPDVGQHFRQTTVSPSAEPRQDEIARWIAGQGARFSIVENRSGQRLWRVELPRQ